MKYVLRVFVVLVLAAGIVYGVFRYTNPEAFVNNNAEVLTTVSKPAATEKNSNRVLLASIEKEDLYLYKGSKGVLLKHGKNEVTFTNWSKFIDAEEPEMHWADFNGDGSKELLIKAVSEKKENGDFLYELYLLLPKTLSYLMNVLRQGQVNLFFNFFLSLRQCFFLGHIGPPQL